MSNDPEPGELPVLQSPRCASAQQPTSDGEGDFVMAYSHILRASSLYYFYKAGFFMRKYYAFFESASSSRGRFFSVGKQWTACKKME